MYNVLWFEDEDYKFQTFKELAEERGFELFPVGVRRKGINELKLHQGKYDAILLDAEMPEESENEKAGTEGIKNVIEVATELQIPLFVSTGQDYLKKNPLFKGIYKHVFVKGFPDKTAGLGGDNELFEAMTDELGQLEKTKIKRMYADVITALSALGLDAEGCDVLLPILCKMHNPEAHVDFNPTLHYTQLRIFIEYLFRKFNEHGILPDAFIVEEGKSNNGRKGVNLDMSCRYLQGAEASYIPFKAKEAIFPIQVGRNISSIIYFANTNSHSAQLTEDEEKLVTAELAKPRSKYTLYSFAMMLCECVLWMYGYIQDHPNYAQNQAQWICTEAQVDQASEKPKVGDIVQLSRDSGGNVFVGRAKVQWSLFKDISDDELANTKYKILNVQDTARTDKVFDKYPFFIKVTKI